MSDIPLTPKPQPEKEIEEAFAVGYESGFYDCHRGGMKKLLLRFRQYRDSGWSALVTTQSLTEEDFLPYEYTPTDESGEQSYGQALANGEFEL